MIVVLLIVSLIISILPCVLFYKWIKKSIDDNKYKELCKKSFIKGLFAALPIIGMSATLFIIGKLVFHYINNPLLYEMYYTMIVLAFSEELVKFLLFKNLIKNNEYKYSIYSLTIFMTIIGLGFQCIESITYSFGSNPIVLAIRGITLGHAGYGFIMGYFYAKMLKTKKKRYGVMGFIIPWLLHGLYDFSLSEEFAKINESLILVAFILAFVSLVLVFIIIRFVRKRKNDKEYLKEIK